MPLLCFFLLALSVLTPGSAAAQAASPSEIKVPVDINLLTIGGFLGQLDGFCEEPGGTYDLEFARQDGVQGCAEKDGTFNREADKQRKEHKEPQWPVTLGGLLGGKAWVERERKATNAVVVVTGNNQVANFTFLDEASLLNPPTGPVKKEELQPDAERTVQTGARFRRFWQEMAALDADAIGLAAEDFVRSLRDPREADTPDAPTKNRPSIFYRWLQQITAPANGPRIISSNAYIKLKETGWFDELQKVKHDGFSLAGIDEDESAGWLTGVTVNHPDQADIAIALYEDGVAPLQIATATTAAGKTTTTLTPAGGALRPGHSYEVVAKFKVEVARGVFESRTVVMRFKTHRALTPRAGNPEPFRDFPVVVKNWIEGSPILIVNLIDPAVKSLVGKDALKWRGPGCPADECEIDFLPPVAAMTSIVSRAYPTGDGRKPFIVLISSLSDTQTQEVLAAFPEIRMVVLPQESFMLGRGSRSYEAKTTPTLPENETLEGRLGRRATVQSYSGDLGLFGIISGDRPPATLLVARPEWIGEVAAKLSAKVTYLNSEWRVDNETAASHLVPGAALEWRPGVCPAGTRAGTTCTVFSMRWQDEEVPYGSFPNFLKCPVTAKPDDKCSRFAELADAEPFNVFAGDTLRRATGSELAIVPGDLVDPDGHAWLKKYLAPTHTDVLTRFTLERVIYRSFRIVRATVSGADLVATIDRALKSEIHEGSCVVGLTDACEKSVDIRQADRTAVNGRAVDRRLFYTIAMPEGLAETLALSRSQGRLHTTDAVSALNQRLEGAGGKGWFVAGKEGTLAERIARRARNTDQYDVAASSVEFGYTRLHLDTPAGQGGTLDALDVDFRSVSPARTLTSKVDFDFAAIDLPWMALRAVTTADFNRRTDIKATGNQITYPSNDLMVGGRFDFKVRARKREIRPYLGYFVERELEGPREYLSAQISLSESTDPFRRTQTHKLPILFTQRPLRFGYGAAGIDFLNPTKFFTDKWISVDVTRAGFQLATGRLHHVPVGASIGGEEIRFGTERGSGDEATKLEDAQAILNDYYERNVTRFTIASFSAVDQERAQRRLQGELHLEPHPTGSKPWKLGVELRYRRYYYPNIGGRSEDDLLRFYWRTRLKLTMQVSSRLEFVPMLEYHYAGVGKPGSERFSHTKFEANLKVPFVLRAPGWGWLIR
jgi:hypothetical protein